jgi:exfoliative toxin A/B
MFEHSRSIIAKVPIPTAGVALGLVALGNLLQPYSQSLRLVLGGCSLFMIVLVTAKACLFPHLIQKDFGSSIIASVSATYCMALMQLAGYLAAWWYPGAFVIWAFAIIAHITLIIWFTVRFLGRFKLKEVFPTYFICFVGIIVASVTAPIFNALLIGRVLFWFGFVCYVALLALITYRYARIPVPTGTEPLFCVYTAPMSLSLAGYLSVYQDPSLAFAAALGILAQFMLILVVIQLPKLLRLKFYPSYAAMTFPFVITAIALSKLLTSFVVSGSTVPSALYGILSVETLLATCMVFYVFLRYLDFLFAEAPIVSMVKRHIFGERSLPESD